MQNMKSKKEFQTSKKTESGPLSPQANLTNKFFNRRVASSKPKERPQPLEKLLQEQQQPPQYVIESDFDESKEDNPDFPSHEDSCAVPMKLNSPIKRPIRAIATAQQSPRLGTANSSMKKVTTPQSVMSTKNLSGKFGQIKQSAVEALMRRSQKGFTDSQQDILPQRKLESKMSVLEKEQSVISQEDSGVFPSDKAFNMMLEKAIQGAVSTVKNLNNRYEMYTNESFSKQTIKKITQETTRFFDTIKVQKDEICLQ
ncbi:hypothetical protein FGO68_gene1266 [Halteria grandinella]|uniref:Uncharacterized protein n=1 Tax=Halteria grandinella TaxID=5974 RepID=A0A8J8NZ40_HALGN|nr:hypothetical protein FGO68_gene1266 [Halteria grandinella]